MSKLAYVITEEGDGALFSSDEEFKNMNLVDSTTYMDEAGTPTIENALTKCEDDYEKYQPSSENDLEADDSVDHTSQDDELLCEKDADKNHHCYSSKGRALRQERSSRVKSSPLEGKNNPRKKRNSVVQERKDLTMIEAVKARPALWHPRHFVDIIERDQLFGEVAELCDMSLQMTKKRWKDKREQFIKVHRRKLSRDNPLCEPKLRKRHAYMHGKNYPPVSADVLNEAVRCIIEQKLSYRQASKKFGISNTSLFAKVQRVKRRAMNVEEPKAEWKWYKRLEFLEEVTRHRYIDGGNDDAVHSIQLSSDEDPTQYDHCYPIEFPDNTQGSLEHQEDSSTMEGESISLKTGSSTTRCMARRLKKTSEKPEVSIVDIQRLISNKPAQQTTLYHSTPAKIVKSHGATDIIFNLSEIPTRANGNKLASSTRLMKPEELSDPLAASNLTDSDLIGRLVTERLKELPTSTRRRLICKITNLLYTDSDNA